MTYHEPHRKSRLRFWLRLLKTSRLIQTELRERLRLEFATTLPRFDAMAALSRDAEGLKMSELSGVLQVSNGNVTGILDRLLEDGLARRYPVPGDRRACLAKLTKKGHAEFARQAAAHERWINDLLMDVEPARAEPLSVLLADVVASTKENES